MQLSILTDPLCVVTFSKTSPGIFVLVCSTVELIAGSDWSVNLVVGGGFPRSGSS